VVEVVPDFTVALILKLLAVDLDMVQVETVLMNTAIISVAAAVTYIIQQVVMAEVAVMALVAQVLP
jgi:hypothetical protein